MCKSCSRILLKPEAAKANRERVSRGEMRYLVKKSVRKAIVLLCKKTTKCHYCGAPNGIVKKAGLLKISHEPYRGYKKDSDVLQKRLAEFDDAAEGNKEIESLVPTMGLIKLLNPIEVLEIFDRIPAEDVPLLLMDQASGRPSCMILTRLPVPPLCIRPSVVSDLKSGKIKLNFPT